MRIAAEVMRVIEALEIAVLLDHPGALFPHEGFYDGGGIFVVIVGGIDVADVVEQGGNDPVGIRAVPPGARRSLQGMPEPRHPVSGQALVELDQRVEQPIRRAGRVGGLVLGQEFVILAVAILHGRELHRLHVGSSRAPRYQRF